MSTSAKAKSLFVIGCLIICAGSFQMIVAFTGSRPFLAVIGAACFAVAFGCCKTNWAIWQRGAR